jgi:hypothetical protein
MALGPSDPDEVAGVELRPTSEIPALLAASALADVETILAGLAAHSSRHSFLAGQGKLA